MSKVPAQWQYMDEIRRLRDAISPTTLLVLNGDVMTKQQGRELAEQYKLDGVMIGRGVFHDPFVFAEASPWATLSDEQRKELYAKHVKLFADTWPDAERKLRTLNKFCKVYIEGFPGAKELRERLMTANSTDELLTLLK